MTTFRCTIHPGVTFAAEGLPDLMARECPVCMADEMKLLRDSRAAAIRQRDDLLRAIEIKRTVQPAE